MRFSVIYSVDVPADEYIEDYYPPADQQWEETEGDEQYEYDYLEGRWEDGNHRKFCAILDREQFDEFISRLGLYAERTETGGSLGAPGFGYRWAPAISFISDSPDAIMSAYVTPIPRGNPPSTEEQTDECWRRVKAAVLAVYG